MNTATPSPSAPTATTTDDRVRFRRTLVRVMTMQIVALLLLWWLQEAFTI